MKVKNPFLTEIWWSKLSVNPFLTEIWWSKLSVNFVRNGFLTFIWPKMKMHRSFLVAMAGEINVPAVGTIIAETCWNCPEYSSKIS